MTRVSDAPVRSPLFSLASMGADRERIEAAILDAVRSADPYLTEIASHLVVAGGKRLRPAWPSPPPTVGGAGASDDVVRGGVACELVHLGSLYHDDVIDEADTRRGVETVNAKWGNLQAILAGDFLLSRASEIAASLGTEVAGLLARTIGWLCEGEIEQLRHTYDVGTARGQLLRRRSRARRRRCSARRPASAASSPGSTARRRVADRWGNAFGMVFQIVDDILDITDTTEQLGKPAGHDMVEGVYTLPVLRTLAMGGGVGEELRIAARQAARRRRAGQGAGHRARQRGRRECGFHGAALRRRRPGRVRRPAAGRGHRRPVRGAGHAARVSRSRGRVARRSALALGAERRRTASTAQSVRGGGRNAARGGRRVAATTSNVAIGWGAGRAAGRQSRCRARC